MDLSSINNINNVPGIDQTTLNKAKQVIKNNPNMVKNIINNNLNNGTLSDKSQPIVKPKKIKPNEKCPCNSGKKYKKCCSQTNQQ